MMVPTNRMLIWVAVIVPPFAALGAVIPAVLFLSLLMIVGLAVLIIVDAAISQGKLAGLSLHVPEVVRFSKDRPGAIEIQVKNPALAGQVVRVGLPWPKEIECPHDDLQVHLPQGSELSRIEWPCTPRKRGNYRLKEAYVEKPSSFGFWAVRAAKPVRGEIRVYPNLLKERKNLAALFLNRGLFGMHAQRQVGKGRDFEKLREYVPGDGYDEIHWKATARRGHPITKVFQVERTQEVYVALDASRLNARRSSIGGVQSEDTLLERFVTSALILGLAAERQGDLFGVISFTNKIESFVRAKNGKAHYSACRDALYTLQPQLVTPDFEDLATFIRMRMRRRALLIILTSLDDPVLAENFVRSLDLLCHQHLVLVNMLKPSGADPLFSGEPVQTVDDMYQRLGGHLQWNSLREVGKKLQRRGVQFSMLDNEKMTLQLVEQYLSVKQRQLL